jgi:hypothetical protein
MPPPPTSVAFAILLLVASSMAGCTTFVTPVACTGGPHACNERADVKFCEREAVAVQGADCPGVRLAPGGRFCVVMSQASVCASTAYRVKDLDCRIVTYRAIQEGQECPVGEPTFAP